MLLGLLEVGLRIGGYGRSTSFFRDGSKVEARGTVVENPEFGRWVFPRGFERTPALVPVALATAKPAGTCRVFVLGESAAMGFPDPSVSFGRILEVMLRARYPGTKFEVVNAAVVAINSHVVLPIARECAGYQPDLFVVHLGNNEVVGPFGASGVLGPYSSSLAIIRANLRVKRTRVGQLLDSLVHGFGGEGEPRAWGGMEMFVNAQVREGDDRLPRVYAHFRQNLDDICTVGASAGVPTVVCTVPVNLKDCAPFLSAHTPDLAPEQDAAWTRAFEDGVRLEAAAKFPEALARYREAADLDPQYAEVEFRAARCLVALGKPAEAGERFARARDLDALRFRSDSAINRTIREVATVRAGDGVVLADAERAFADASPNRVPGEELFLEHVHMNFSGNYVLARTVLESAAPALDTRHKRAELAAGPLTEHECADRLGYTDWNEMKLARQVRDDLLTHPPFTNQLDRAEREVRWSGKIELLQDRLKDGGLARAVAVCQKAAEEARGDWMLRMNFAQLLTECGDPDGAEEQYKAVLARLRHNPSAYYKLGLLKLSGGQTEQAIGHFRDAIRLASEWSDAHFGLAAALAAQGKVDEGLAVYEDRLRKDPDRGAVLLGMGTYLLRANRLDAARTRLEEAARARPNNPIPHAFLADIAYQQGRRDDAVAHYEEALRLKPDWPELRDQLARVKAGPPPAVAPK